MILRTCKEGRGGGALGGHLEIGGRRPSRSDPAQVRVLRLGHTARARTCVGGLGFEKLLQDVSVHFPGLPVDPGSILLSHVFKDDRNFRFSLSYEVLPESTDPGASCGVQTTDFIKH